MRLRGLRGLVVLTAWAIGASGCANFGYYLQSVSGQLELWGRERAIDDVLADPLTPAPLKRKLGTVQRIREFASRELGLPDNASYRRYADLERPYAVWNVFATPELSVTPVRWCFLFAGCVSYRGYFSKAEAERFAASLAARRYDVFVGGVPAYSTIGWFSDPVLNTFIRYPEAELARIIFHELAHQVVYVRDDTAFNESFAVTVEREGVRRWLEREGMREQRSAFELKQGRREAFTALVARYRDKLDALYRSREAEARKRAGKAELFRAMQEEYRQLKAGWSGYNGFDRFFAQPPNNALLASVAIYTRMVPEFQALLAREGGDLPRFYDAVKRLAGLPREERARELARLDPSRGASDKSRSHRMASEPKSR